MPVPLTRDPTPQKVPIGAQISELRRELEMRARVYPKLVRDRSLRQSEADLFVSRMEAALRTLEFMAEHRETILAAVEAKKGAA